MKIIWLLLALTISGCGNFNVSSNGYEANIKIYTLEDGTKCAYLIGFSKGGISCNWGNL